MNIKFLMACIMLGFISCGDKENTGNGADDKPEKGPYQYRNDSLSSDAQSKLNGISNERKDSLGQN